MLRIKGGSPGVPDPGLEALEPLPPVLVYHHLVFVHALPASRHIRCNTPLSLNKILKKNLLYCHTYFKQSFRTHERLSCEWAWLNGQRVRLLNGRPGFDSRPGSPP